MMLRRRLINKKTKTTYINLTADASGYIDKTAIQISEGSIVNVTWDTSNLGVINNEMTLVSLYGQTKNFSSLNSIPPMGGYPILAKPFHSTEIANGSLQFTALSKDFIIYVSCWTSEDYADPTAKDRRVKIAFINFEIREG